MSELKPLTREEAIVMTENSLNFWESGNYKDHDEPDIKRNTEYYKMLLDSLRQPRFTPSEIQAIEAVLKMAEQPEAPMHFRGVHISRVRFMLAGKGGEE
jgi:hypothetical protein